MMPEQRKMIKNRLIAKREKMPKTKIQTPRKITRKK